MERDTLPIEEFNARRKGVPAPSRVDTETLMAIEFPPTRWIVPGYLPEGLSILAGRQKLGKTWLAMDWAVAVACGAAAMGSIQCEQGDVLYIDLENGQRRIQSRLRTLFQSERNRPNLARLQWMGSAPRLDKGFTDLLDTWRHGVEAPRLVVIDVLQRIKPPGRAGQNSYENDYVAMSALQKWATGTQIAVLALHHTRKGGADDPLEALSGSNGLSACADTTLVLDRQAGDITLYVRGRDVEEVESAMSFTAGIWNVTGDAANVRRSSERGNILDALQDASDAMSPSDLTDVTGMKGGNVRRLLHSMVRDGEVLKSGRGRYVHPSNGPPGTQ